MTLSPAQLAMLLERPSPRKPLPDHLPRTDVRLDIDDMTSADCGDALQVIGESVSEYPLAHSFQWTDHQMPPKTLPEGPPLCRTGGGVINVYD